MRRTVSMRKKKCLRCELCNLDSGVRVRVSFFSLWYKTVCGIWRHQRCGSCCWILRRLLGCLCIEAFLACTQVCFISSTCCKGYVCLFVCFFASVIAVPLWKPVIKGYYFVLVVSSLYIENQFSAIWKKFDSCLKLINEFYWPSFLVFLLFCFNFFFCCRRSFVKTSDK